MPLLVLPAWSKWDFDQLTKSLHLKNAAAANKMLAEIQTLFNGAKTQAETEQLKRVNAFFNSKLSFNDDSKIWNTSDYWATPLETISKAAGDCEDFAIIKYFSLKELGVAPEKLRLSYVKAKIGGSNSTITQAHMVLTYYATPDAEPLVLDNLITEIRPASRRPDLTPVFSFNSEGIYAGSGAQPTAAIDRLSRWKDVLLRMKSEGINF
ncbi:transglutaminase-like cysteine peptidase [Chitinibacter sp. S2-10]|uniref:transglutaminase-like cysteine peptidase n=1 Tax=Chitinibacter sp. S2-10 TaxID=3373597 RepID=UPI003977D211